MFVRLYGAEAGEDERAYGQLYDRARRTPGVRHFDPVDRSALARAMVGARVYPYPTTVEEVIHTHPAVFDVAVIGIPDKKWGEAVKAFIALKPGAKATESEIIDYCKGYIAGYKVPKSIAFVAELPKTGSGKIYKKGIKDLWLRSDKS
mgnify:CR=1 FL=1